jgi:nicotinamidase-related amidase
LTRGENPAVVVIDFQYAMTDPESPAGADMTDAVENCRRILDTARARGLLVVFTTAGWEATLADAGLFREKAPVIAATFHVGTRWLEIDGRLEVREEELVIVKKFPSGVFGTHLTSVLTSHGIDTIVLCGSTTSGCVRATAVDLFSHGYPTLVPRDAVADRAPGPHEANLFDLDAKYADVISTEEAIEYLQSVPARAARELVTR